MVRAQLGFAMVCILQPESLAKTTVITLRTIRRVCIMKYNTLHLELRARMDIPQRAQKLPLGTSS